MQTPAHDRRVLVFALAATFALTACGDASNAVPDLAEWALAPEPSLRIGSLDDGPDALVAVSALAVAPDGRMFVAQSQDGQVRVYGADGTLEARIGQSGEGPGEFQAVSRLGRLGDTLWVTDGRLRRTSYFDPAGTLVRDERHPDVAPPDEDHRTAFVQPLARGLAVATTSAQFQSDLDGTDHPFPVMVTRRDGAEPRTVGFRNLEHERAMFVGESAGTVTSIEIFVQRWSDHTLWAAAPDGRSIVLLERPVAASPDSGSYGVTRVGLAGDTIFSTRVPYEPTVLAAAERDSLVRRYASSGRSESDVRSVLFLPELHPPATDVFVALDGATWVARERPDGAQWVTWDVLSPEGEHLARVTGPSGLRLLAADGMTVWGVETGTFDEPYVVRYDVTEERPRSIQALDERGHPGG